MILKSIFLMEESHDVDMKSKNTWGFFRQTSSPAANWAPLAPALEDPMFFYDEIFAVEPLSGRIWAKSKIAITFTFTPKAGQQATDTGLNITWHRLFFLNISFHVYHLT